MFETTIGSGKIFDKLGAQNLIEREKPLLRSANCGHAGFCYCLRETIKLEFYAKIFCILNFF